MSTTKQHREENWNALGDDAFRRAVRAFIEERYPAELRFLPFRPPWRELKPWVMLLVEKGWSAPNWPVKYGGMGLSPGKLLIFIDEQERWGVARAPDHGIVQVGPMLIQFGSEEQKRNVLPGMRTFETIWCQGYSEPGSGSDLASLVTEAVADGDHFVINGRKIWTSFALDATHTYLLARTDRKAKQQEGITFFLVDLSLPGAARRGIKNIAGATEYCEMVFDGVRVHRSNIVGELNKGWTVAKSVLNFERLNSGSPRRAQFAFERLRALAQERGVLGEPDFRKRYTELRLDLADLKAVYAYFADQVKRGQPLGADVSILKVMSTELNQRITEFMLETAGDLGLVAAGERGDIGRVDALTPFLDSRGRTIGAGTSEIHRNVVAKRVLGLPAA
ncbi:MAG: acyl-CoA dehydrogenase family protein [Burkholderiales bacterium]|nr:acyl-CoA dehydrogenase family protein [Burkholderiales bacterium]